MKLHLFLAPMDGSDLAGLLKPLITITEPLKSIKSLIVVQMQYERNCLIFFIGQVAPTSNYTKEL